MTSWDVKVLRRAAAVCLCHLLSQKEQEQKEAAEGRTCSVVLRHVQQGFGENTH